MEDAIKTFHRHKKVFLTLKIREDFNIPKLHSLLHYVSSIRLFGTTDNYNTEMFERLHIDYAKEAWRASNHRDERPQMIRWLGRRERMVRFERYLKHRIPTKFPKPEERRADKSGTSEIIINSRPHDRNVPISSIDQTSPGFERALKEYLNTRSMAPLSRANIARSSLPFQTVSLYYNMTLSRVELGHTEVLSSFKDTEIVKAQPASGNRSGIYDTVIVYDTPDAEATGVEGMYCCYFNHTSVTVWLI